MCLKSAVNLLALALSIYSLDYNKEKKTSANEIISLHWTTIQIIPSSMHAGIVKHMRLRIESKM